MNSRLGVAGLLTALLAVAACDDPVPGVARRASTTTVSTTGSTTTPTSPPGTAAPTTSPPGTATPTSPSGTAGPVGSLETADPCELVTEDETESTLGAQRKDPKPERIGTARACTFYPEQATFVVGIRTNVGLAGVQPNGGVVKDITVGGRPAKELLGATGSCGIYLGVSDSSRVDVVLNASSSGGDPCPPARRIAELVEPRLP